MAERAPGPLAADELLASERKTLDEISQWYTNTDWGFYTRLVWYSYVTVKPFLVGETCLEMGPADGHMTRLLANDFTSLTVVDAAEKYVSAATALGPDNITGHVSLFEEFAPSGRFDTIIMAHVLEHLVDPVAVLSRAATWLADGGRLIVVVPNADSLHRRLGVKLGMLATVAELNEQDVAIGHRRVYDPQLLDHDTRAAGLRTVAKGGVFLKLLSNSQMLSFEDDAVIDAMFELGKDFPQLCSEIFTVLVSADT